MKQSLLLLAFLASARCNPHSAQPQQAQNSTANDADHVTVAAATLPSLTVQTVAAGRAPASLVTTGKVTFDEERYARILSPVAGQVTALNVRIGDRVHRGETLAVVRSREAAAAINEQREARKDFDLAEKTYAMTRDLFEHDAASRISLDQAESDLEKAKARVERTSRSVAVLGLTERIGEPAVPLRSPIDGVVVARNVTAGQLVQGDAQPLLEVADLGRVWVVADVFERDLRYVGVGQKGDLVANAYPDQHFSAKVAKISDSLDPATRTAKVRLTIANPDRVLKPEMFATVRLTLGVNENAIMLPTTATVVEDGHAHVFVRTAERTFERRAVEVTPEGVGRVRVTRGLRVGEQIVTDGALMLRAEQRKD